MTTPRDELQTLERQAFDALTAVAFAVNRGMVQRIMITGNAAASVVAYLPNKAADGTTPPACNFLGDTVLGALVDCGRALDHLIHVAAQDGAPVQAYLEMRGKAQALRKRPLIVVPN
jgi:hypothetical protein